MTFLTRLSYSLPNLFWQAWGFGLLMLPLVPLWMFGKSWGHPHAEPGVDGDEAVSQARPSPIAAGCFVALLVLYIGFMLWGEDFAYEDGHHFTDWSAVGRAHAPSVWPSAGRFFPLGYLEYNLLGRLSPTATVYLAFGAVQLLLGLWLLYKVMPCQSRTLRLLALTVLLFAPAFAADFAELTYADRNVVFSLCILLFAVERYDRRPTPSLLLLAIVVTHFGLYYKEITAAMFGGFALARMALKIPAVGVRRAVLQSPLEIGMVLSCAYFAVLLGLTLLPSRTSHYVESVSVGRLHAMLGYLKADPLLLLFVIVFAIHVVLAVRAGRRLDTLWDALAVAALLHFAAACFVGIEEDYLLGATELVAVLTLLRILSAWWREHRKVRPALACIVPATLAVSATFATFRLIDRKTIVRQTIELGDFLVGHLRTPAASRVRLYFPTSGEGEVMNFASYLNYRGLQVRRPAGPRKTDTVDIAGPQEFIDNHCGGHEDYVCKHDTARSGDISIRLAEDTNEMGERLAGLTQQPLFQIDPVSASSVLRPILSGLYWMSPMLRGKFHHQPLPNDWRRVSAIRVTSTLTTTPSARQD
jgi:hypothetical protein